MNVVSHGPWQTGSLLWQPRAGAWALTVVCQSAFEITPGESPNVPLKREKVEPDDERSFIEPWGPIVPRKPRPEVVMIGHAYAPVGRQVSSLLARLSVGSVDKAVQVQGDCHFTQDGTIIGPSPFIRMSIGWSRASGGPHTNNPIGVRMGSEALSDTFGRVPLPNVRPIGTTIVSPDQVVPPVGFGPHGPTWPARVQRLHRHAASWDAARWADRPLPDDFDATYFNAAPQDQLLNELTGNERIVLENLHPRFTRVVTYLRARTPVAVTSSNGVEQPVPLQCDTLVIDTDRGIAVLVWRGVVPLDHPQREGVVLVSTGIEDSGSTTGTLDNSVVRTLDAPLPFQRPPSASIADAVATPFAPRATQAGESRIMAAPRLRGEDNVEQTLTAVPVRRYPTLPFKGPAGSSPPRDDDGGDDGPPTQRRSVVPAAPVFGAPPLDVATPPPLPVIEPAPPSPPVVAAPPPVVVPPPPVVVPPPVFVPPPPVVVTPPVFEPPPMVAPPPPAPPPMLFGAALAFTPPPPEPEPPPVAKPPEPPPPPPPEPAPEPPPPPPVLTPSEDTVERCAAISARRARRPDDGAAILEAEGLTPEAWEKRRTRWQGEIDSELSRGKKKLLTSYDAAYVAALEEERGPITAGDYAKIAAAAELGSGASVLSEMGLPEESMMRIRRVWLARMVKDPKLAAEVKAARRAAAE